MINFVKQWLCRHEFVVTKLKGFDNEFIHCNHLIECSKCGKLFRADKVTDGYHSFDELYDHRCILFITLMKQMPDKAFWTYKNKEEETWDGWIICAIETKHGQISYHVPVKYIGLLKDYIQEKECNDTYDEHTSVDVLERLKRI